MSQILCWYCKSLELFSNANVPIILLITKNHFQAWRWNLPCLFFVPIILLMVALFVFCSHNSANNKEPLPSLKVKLANPWSQEKVATILRHQSYLWSVMKISIHCLHHAESIRFNNNLKLPLSPKLLLLLNRGGLTLRWENQQLSFTQVSLLQSSFFTITSSKNPFPHPQSHLFILTQTRLISPPNFSRFFHFPIGNRCMRRRQ